MSRDFSRIKIQRVSHRNSSKRRRSKKKNTVQDSSTSQTDIVDGLSLKGNREAIINSKQQRINREGQVNPIFTQTKKEIDQSNLFDCPRNSLPINSITKPTTCFDLSITHRSFNWNHQDLFERDFKFNIDGKYVE